MASSSPRRRELLDSIGLKFKVIESNFEENSLKEKYKPYDLAKVLAFNKAKDVYLRYDCGIVLGADTVVILGDKVYGKPKDEDDARVMLRDLSGRAHDVVTGVSLIGRKGQIVTESEITKVIFKDLDKDDIDAYIKTRDYVGKAGAYGIQGKGAVLVKKIEGSYSNVVGLPIEILCGMFEKIGDSIYARWQ